MRNCHLAAMSLLTLVVAALLSGCPRSDAAAKPSRPCAKFGDSCEFAPGKLGSCVRRDDCVGNDCFVCQSQH